MKNKEVDKLAEHLAFCTRGELKHDSLDKKNAKYLIRNGYIHKFQGVDYVEICKKCGATGYGDEIGPCWFCQGRGVVLKQD